MINLIGVGPTPTIFLQNGKAISGYKPYDEILAILREKKLKKLSLFSSKLPVIYNSF